MFEDSIIKISKSYKNCFKLYFRSCTLFPQKCPHNTPSQNTVVLHQRLFKVLGRVFFIPSKNGEGGYCTPGSYGPEYALSRILSIAHDGLQILMSVHFEFISVLSSRPSSRLQRRRNKEARGALGIPLIFKSIKLNLSTQQPS